MIFLREGRTVFVPPPLDMLHAVLRLLFIPIVIVSSFDRINGPGKFYHYLKITYSLQLNIIDKYLNFENNQ